MSTLCATVFCKSAILSWSMVFFMYLSPPRRQMFRQDIITATSLFAVSYSFSIFLRPRPRHVRHSTDHFAKLLLRSRQGFPTLTPTSIILKFDPHPKQIQSQHFPTWPSEILRSKCYSDILIRMSLFVSVSLNNKVGTFVQIICPSLFIIYFESFNKTGLTACVRMKKSNCNIRTNYSSLTAFI